jgi:hypothetical protein
LYAIPHQYSKGAASMALQIQRESTLSRPMPWFISAAA